MTDIININIKENGKLSDVVLICKAEDETETKVKRRKRNFTTLLRTICCSLQLHQNRRRKNCEVLDEKEL